MGCIHSRKINGRVAHTGVVNVDQQKLVALNHDVVGMKILMYKGVSFYGDIVNRTI